MTSITIGSGGTIPTAANTLTKLAVWTALKIEEVQPKWSYNLFQGASPEKLVSWTILKHPDYGRRFAFFWVLPLPVDYSVTAGKFFSKPTGIPFDTSKPIIGTQAINLGSGGQIPSAVTDLAKLAAWVTDALDLTVGNAKVKEYDEVIINNQVVGGGFIPAIQKLEGEDLYGQKVFTLRGSIPMEDPSTSTASEYWKQVKDFSNVSIPELMLSN